MIRPQAITLTHSTIDRAADNFASTGAGAPVSHDFTRW
jgi:hypothetical protein